MSQILLPSILTLRLLPRRCCQSACLLLAPLLLPPPGRNMLLHGMSERKKKGVEERDIIIAQLDFVLYEPQKRF